MTEKSLNPDLQIGFYYRLQAIRESPLFDKNEFEPKEENSMSWKDGKSARIETLKDMNDNDDVKMDELAIQQSYTGRQLFDIIMGKEDFTWDDLAQWLFEEFQADMEDFMYLMNEKAEEIQKNLNRSGIQEQGD